ncbi:MAG: universal stress protein [Pseudanabaenaceae cyanobacterium bins.68]|nr:universal stress protein [Pseudanabaenaceae cyanobacterium bins.68]
MKILTALDHSQVSQNVFEKSLALALPLKAELILLTVVESTPPYFSSIALPTGDLVGIQNYPDLELEARLLSAAQQLLDQYQQIASDRQVSCQTRLEQGNPREKICAIAQAETADLLIIGSRGLGNLERLMLGSVSDYVVHHAPCAVMVVR